MPNAASFGAVLFVILTSLAAGSCDAQERPDTFTGNQGFFLTAARKLFKWDEPAAPARIVGPIHFVGTKGLGVFLITTTEGHIVINTGMPGSGPMIETSIRMLGYRPEDIKILLAGHAHCDHVGGHAYLKKLSGAQIAMIREERELFESGGTLDFQYGASKEFSFEPAKVDRMFFDGDEIKLGDVTLTAHLTKGHTRGSTTFTMSVTEEGKTYRVVIPTGTSVNPGYRLGTNPSYPGIADDFRRTFQTLASLEADIWLAAHNEVYRFDEKRMRSTKEGTAAWVDPDGYKNWVAGELRKFEAAVGRK